MEEVENLVFGYKDANFKVSSLFYMDDSIIMARSKNEVENLINKIESISLKYGLTLNHSKCSIMAVNEKDADDNIGNIEVVKQIKYLGVMVENKRKMFQGHKIKSFDKGIQFGNQLYSILGNSYNRMLIGKTFYKGLVLPNILYGQDIIVYNKSELEQLQKFDNKACRTILNVPTYTAVEFLRGEVGMSSATARDMKNKIMFLKHALKDDGNTILKEIVIDDWQNETMTWTKNTKDYMNKLNMNIDFVKQNSINKIKSRINEWDSDIWRDGCSKKFTLSLYYLGI